MEQDRTVHILLAVEHSRLHVVNAWPESIRKQALLTAIRHSINQIARDPQARSFTCLLCRTPRPVEIMPSLVRRESIPSTLRKVA